MNLVQHSGSIMFGKDQISVGVAKMLESTFVHADYSFPDLSLVSAGAS